AARGAAFFGAAAFFFGAGAFFRTFFLTGDFFFAGDFFALTLALPFFFTAAMAPPERMERCNPSRRQRTYQRNSARTASAIAPPSSRCWSASRWTPSTRLDGVTAPASKKWQPSSAATLRYSPARPADFAPAPANFGAIGPLGSPIGGGATTSTGGTGMP